MRKTVTLLFLFVCLAMLFPVSRAGSENGFSKVRTTEHRSRFPRIYKPLRKGELPRGPSVRSLYGTYQCITVETSKQSGSGRIKYGEVTIVREQD